MMQVKVSWTAFVLIFRLALSDALRLTAASAERLPLRVRAIY